MSEIRLCGFVIFYFVQSAINFVIYRQLSQHTAKYDCAVRNDLGVRTNFRNADSDFMFYVNSQVFYGTPETVEFSACVHGTH